MDIGYRDTDTHYGYVIMTSTKAKRRLSVSLRVSMKRLTETKRMRSKKIRKV
jgi:hypothetical protein